MTIQNPKVRGTESLNPSGQPPVLNHTSINRDTTDIVHRNANFAHAVIRQNAVANHRSVGTCHERNPNPRAGTENTFIDVGFNGPGPITGRDAAGPDTEKVDVTQ